MRGCAAGLTSLNHRLIHYPEAQEQTQDSYMYRVDELEKPSRHSALDKGVVKVAGRDGNVEFTIDDEVDASVMEDGLRHYLSESGGWFAGGAITVNIGRRVLNLEELSRLRQVFEDEFHLEVARFWCGTEAWENAILQEAGVPVSLVPQGTMPRPSLQMSRPWEAPLVIRSTCRSGTTIHHEGDLVVLADVNPGAQISAAGDIIVFGTLRGIAHAGTNGTDPAREVIMALALRPHQLRIGWHVSLAPFENSSQSIPGRPEIAYVSGRSIAIKPFTSGFQRTEGGSLP